MPDPFACRRSMAMTRFLLIRHATNDTVGKTLAGRKDGVHLNEEGRVQANDLVSLLGDIPVHAIYSSPLLRAMETAEPLANARRLDIRSCEDFLEMDFGDWTGLSFDTLSKDKQFQLFNSFRSCTRVPGGELMSEAQTRAVAALQRLSELHPEQTVAVFSHADIIRAIVAWYTGIHLDMFQRLEISPASVSVLEIFSETARLTALNCRAGIKI